MKTKRIISLVLTAVLVICLSVTTLADTGYDDTAPVLKSFRILNPDEVNAKRGEGFDIELNLVEEGTGVTEVQIFFENEAGQGFTAEYGFGREPIFTGTRKVHVVVTENNEKIKPGTYKVRGILLADGNENFLSIDSSLDPSAYPEVWKNSTKTVKVTKTNYDPDRDITPPELHKFSIRNPENIDIRKGMYMDFEITEKGSGLASIGICYESEDGGPNTAEYYSVKNGETKNIKFNLKSLNNGRNHLTAIVLADHNENERFYFTSEEPWNQYCSSFTVTNAPSAPTLEEIHINSSKILTPGVLSLDIKIGGNPNGASVQVTLENEKGQQKTLSWNHEQILKPGMNRIKLPISPFFGVGKWHVESVLLVGKSGKMTAYYKDNSYGGANRLLNDVSGFEDKEIEISSFYQITYYGSVGNPKTAVEKMKAMKEGQTAVLDCRYSKWAKKALFEAIAGQNKTLVFEDEDVQWVFNGKNIKKSACKDIDLTSEIKKVSGAKYGFADDSYILYMCYADNGKLPGKVEMRVNYEYLFEKYGESGQKLLLSYYDDGEIENMGSNAKVAKDYYAEYNITHNSTYLLSEHKPRLAAPSKFQAKSYKDKQIYLKWNRVGGATGYRVYKSSSRNGTYRYIGKTSSNSKTTYIDRNTRAGKTYYYRVKASETSKKIPAAYSQKVSCKAVPGKVYKVKTKKYYKSIKITWQKVSLTSGYQVYMSVNRSNSFKKKKTTSGTAYTTGKLKTGNTYYFKVRSYKKIGGRRYYGPYSTVIKKTI